MTQTAGHQFFQKVLPVSNAPPASNCCAFSDVACRGSFGPMRRMQPVRGEPAMVISDQQVRLSGRKRGCRPLDRAVCRWRFIGSSERTEPIAPDQSVRHNGYSHRTVIAPPIGATGLLPDCLLPANWPRNCEYGRGPSRAHSACRDLNDDGDAFPSPEGEGLCPRNGTIRFDAWHFRVTTHFVGAGIIQGQVGPETSNNISSRKDLHCV